MLIYIRVMSNTAKPMQTVAVLGYGSQGHAVALNLRDSGYPVVVGLRPRSGSRTRARKAGISRITTVRQAVAQADVICFAFPDHLHQQVYEEGVKPYLARKTTLWFLHALSVHFGLVRPKQDCDVILVAPHGPGVAVRQAYLSDRTLSAFYSVYQNRSGQAEKTALLLGMAMGFSRHRMLKTTFETEAVGDLFGEQAVLCGGLASLIKNGFEVLVENGVPPDNAYLEVAYQLDLIVNLIKNHGIEGMFERISVAARYGSLLSGPRVLDRNTKNRMQRVYKDIESGRFARKLQQLTVNDIARLDRRLKELTSTALEKAARKFAP